MRNKVLRYIIISSTYLLFNCTSQKLKFEKRTVDDYSNRSNYQDYNMLINSMARKSQIEKTKVIFNEEIFEFSDFMKNIGFKDTDDLKIIKDSISIKKYDLKNCKTLFIVNRK